MLQSHSLNYPKCTYFDLADKNETLDSYDIFSPRKEFKASKVPFFCYTLEKLCGCCYERAWFAKSGGCSAIEFLMNNMPLQWVIEQQPMFISALMFVMMDLTNEVSISYSITYLFFIRVAIIFSSFLIFRANYLVLVVLPRTKRVYL